MSFSTLAVRRFGRLRPDIPVVQLVDAGAPYGYALSTTDAKAAANDVTAIAIPAADNATTSYPIAAISKAPNPALAKEFVAYVLSDAGQAVLAQAGFAAP